MTTIMAADDDALVGLQEIAERANRSKQAVHTWTHLDYMKFPKPVATLAAGRIWRWGDVKKWLVEHEKSRRKL